ncbi:Leu/Val/Ile amino-acid permease [Trichinella pseudospiralis]
MPYTLLAQSTPLPKAAPTEFSPGNSKLQSYFECAYNQREVRQLDYITSFTNEIRHIEGKASPERHNNQRSKNASYDGLVVFDESLLRNMKSCSVYM